VGLYELVCGNTGRFENYEYLIYLAASSNKKIIQEWLVIGFAICNKKAFVGNGIHFPMRTIFKTCMRSIALLLRKNTSNKDFYTSGTTFYCL